MAGVGSGSGVLCKSLRPQAPAALGECSCTTFVTGGGGERQLASPGLRECARPSSGTGGPGGAYAFCGGGGSGSTSGDGNKACDSGLCLGAGGGVSLSLSGWGRARPQGFYRTGRGSNIFSATEWGVISAEVW